MTTTAKTQGQSGFVLNTTLSGLRGSGGKQQVVILKGSWGQDDQNQGAWKAVVHAFPDRKPDLRGSLPAETVLVEIEDLLGDYEVRLGRQDLAEVIAPSLRKLRYAAGLTQHELAEKIGWNQSNVAALERSSAPNPTLEIMERLAAALDVDLNTIAKSLSAQRNARIP